MFNKNDVYTKAYMKVINESEETSVDEKGNKISVEFSNHLDWNDVSEIFDEVIETIEQWEEDEISPEEIDGIDRLFDDIDNGLDDKTKRDILKTIVTVWEKTDHSIHDEEIIREGIAQWIDNVYNFDCR